MKTEFFSMKRLMIFVSIIIFLVTIKVEATSCSSEEKRILKEEAKKIEIIPYLDETPNPLNEYVYSVNITNFSDKFYIVDGGGNRYEYTSQHSNDSLYGVYLPNSNSSFKVYGAYEKECQDELLATYKIKFDPYNYYYSHQACDGIEEFYLCNRTYSGVIESEEWFLEQVEKYKNGEVEIPGQEAEKQENKTLDFIKDNLFLIIITLILVVSAIIYIIIKRKQKSIKINLSKKHVFLLAILLISLFVNQKVSALEQSTNGGAAGGGSCPSCSWVYNSEDDKGIRISLYRYNGKKLSFIKSVDFVGTKRSSYYCANATGRFSYKAGEEVKFSECGSRLKIQTFTGYNKSIGKEIFTNIKSKEIINGKTWGVLKAQEINNYFGNTNQSIIKKIKEMFGVVVKEEELSEYYLIMEPTIAFYNSDKYYYGTGYEFMNSTLDSIGDGKGQTGFYLQQRNTIVNYLYNGLYIATNKGLQYEYNGQKDGRYDYYNFVNINPDKKPIVTTSSNVIAGGDWEKFYQVNNNKTNQAFPYGITVFWIGKTAMECSSTCSGKTGDAFLMCAENFCANQTNVNNSTEKANCITKTCGYKYDKLSCGNDKTTNGSNTTCSSTSSSSKETCQIVNKENYSYQVKCTTTSNVLYPTTLPTSLTAGSGFEYQVKLYGNKTCTITFDSELWKYNYASSYTDAERSNLIDAITSFNKLSLSSYIYDSSNGNINIKINEKNNDDNKTTNKTLKPETDYYLGSKNVTETYTNKNINSYHKNNTITATIKTYTTDSSNGTLYNLPGVCVSSVDNVTIAEGSVCKNGLGPYNKYFTGIYAAIANNQTETKVVHSSAGMDNINKCNYQVKDNNNELSCYIVAETKSNQSGNVLINNEDIVLKLYAVSSDKTKILNYNLGDAIKGKKDQLNNLSTTTIYKNTIRFNENKVIYGTVTDGTNYAYCKKELIITPNSCEFEIQKNATSTTIRLKSIPGAEYYIKDSTSNKWMKIQSRTINNNTKIIIEGMVKKGESVITCSKEFLPEELKTCTNLYKPTEYVKIRSYCGASWQNDTAGYSSESECYTHCTNPNGKNTCKSLYSCSDTLAIRQYCKVNYQVDGYKTIGNCINDCSCGSNGLKYYYRTISQNNPFPDREAHSNWLGYEEYITDDKHDSTSSTSGGNPEYEIVLDSKRIDAISKHTQKYNAAGNDAYGDFIRIDEKDTGSYKSKFIHEDDISEGGFSSYFTYIEGIKTGG